MLVHSRKVDLTLNVVEPLRGEEFPEIDCCLRKTVTPLEFTKVLIAEDVIESFVKREDHAVQVLRACSDSPCHVRDVTDENVVVSLMYRRGGKTRVVEVGVSPVILVSLLVESCVHVGLRALHDSGLDLTLQQTDRA